MRREPRTPSRSSHLRLVGDDVAPAPRTRARDRIVIVPLDAPQQTVSSGLGLEPDPEVPRLAPAVQTDAERRQHWPGREPNRDPYARLACPKCSERPRIDHVDLVWGRVHLSCDNCCWMWQERVRSTDRPRPGKIAPVER